MTRHIAQKIATAFVTIFVIITISFFLVHIMPGDPVIHLVGQEEYYYLLDNDPETLNKLIARYGLDDSLPVQYGKYLKNIVTMDFGPSYTNQKPVVSNVLKACKWTLLLSIPTWIIGGLLGALLGVIAGWKPGKLIDKIMTPLLLVVNTIPSNCFCLFPINGMVSPGVEGMARVQSILQHMFLPLIIMILYRTSGDFMLMKSAVSQVRSEEYIMTAESKGLPSRRVLFRHVMKNAMVPYATSFCMQFGGILSGSMIIEVVFGWKGMGTILYNAVSNRDFPTAQFCFLLSAALVVFANLISDIVNAAIDPRIREEGIQDA